MIAYEEIVRRFGYHAADSTTAPVFDEIRRYGIEAADFYATLPPGRELALALTALQEAQMWAIAAVACAV